MCVTTGYGAFRAMRNLTLASVSLTTAVFAEPLTIAALGDSLTQGYGLPEADGLVPQLQTWLTQQGAEVTVINAGVSGDTTAGGLSRAAWTLTPEVDGLIVALGGNDLLRGIDPAVSRANIKGILDAAQTADVPVLLVGIEAPGNYGPDYKADFDAIFPELSAEYESLYHPGFIESFEDIRSDSEALLQFMQPDGIHPNSQGVARIVAHVGPSVLELIEKAQTFR